MCGASSDAVLRSSLIVPLLLSDNGLKYFLSRSPCVDKSYDVNHNSYILAMEYRAMYNNLMLNRPNYIAGKNPVSCISEVRQLLFAFLVQARKDFELYGTDEKFTFQSREQYVRCFHDLALSEEAYVDIKNKLITNVFGENSYAEFDARNLLYKK